MLTAVYLRLEQALIAVAGIVGGRLRPKRAGLAGARGVTFIEYALLAGIAVAIAAIFRSQLTDIFTTLLDRINGGVNNP